MVGTDGASLLDGKWADFGVGAQVRLAFLGVAGEASYQACNVSGYRVNSGGCEVDDAGDLVFAKEQVARMHVAETPLQGEWYLGAFFHESESSGQSMFHLREEPEHDLSQGSRRQAANRQGEFSVVSR